MFFRDVLHFWKLAVVFLMIRLFHFMHFVDSVICRWRGFIDCDFHNAFSNM